jgi:sugar/nucleoside kinase (ribokinase family)
MSRVCRRIPYNNTAQNQILTAMNIPDLRAQCASALLANAARAATMSAFVGLDGFVDEILHAVDKRENAEKYHRLPTIAKLAERLAGAAGKSANLELVNQMTKLGGNGPIMANALASLGLKVTYLGVLGYPNIHPVFHEFAKRAEVHSIADPGTTDALEFEDGKIMVGKHTSLKQVTWENIQTRFGREKFDTKFGGADLVGFVNWTMLPYMSDLWQSILSEVCPTMKGRRRILFFDLADPEKRTREDILRALQLIGQFEKYFDVILGLNEKEAHEVGEVFGLRPKTAAPESLAEFSVAVAAKLKVSTLVVHPVTYALAVSEGKSDLVGGPYIAKPLITTGAGDHFNSGFCLGKLLGLSNPMSLLTGVTTSGYYVRTGLSPSIPQLATMMTDPAVQYLRP